MRIKRVSPDGSAVNNLPAMQKTAYNAGDVGLIPLVGEDPLENEMATEPSILAQEMPWTEKPGRLQSIGHNLTTKAPALPSLLYGTCLGQYLVNY